jgi:hypothetical protein
VHGYPSLPPLTKNDDFEITIDLLQFLDQLTNGFHFLLLQYQVLDFRSGPYVISAHMITASTPSGGKFG